MWKWKEVKLIKDGLAIATKRGADDVKGPYWVPALSNTNVIMVSLSRLLYLPTELVKLCVDRPKTGEDLFQELGRLV